MPAVTLPPPGAHPEHWEATKLLIAHGVEAERVVRVYAAGDPLAERDAEGVPLQTVLYMAGGRACTAVIDATGAVTCWLGWGEPATA